MSEGNVFSERLIHEMRQRHLSQYALAKAVGVDHRSLARWTSGGFSPSVDALVVLSDYLGVSIDYLLGRSQEAQPIPVQVSVRSDLPKQFVPGVEWAIAASLYLALVGLCSQLTTSGWTADDAVRWLNTSINSLWPNLLVAAITVAIARYYRGKQL